MEYSKYLTKGFCLTKNTGLCGRSRFGLNGEFPGISVNMTVSAVNITV